MGSIFSTVKTNMAAKPGVLITSLLLQLEAIPNLKWSYKASRVYVTSNNSVLTTPLSVKYPSSRTKSEVVII